jgi:hypothetical protein
MRLSYFVSAPLKPREKASWTNKTNNFKNRTNSVEKKALKEKRVTSVLTENNMGKKKIKTNDEVLFYKF